MFAAGQKPMPPKKKPGYFCNRMGRTAVQTTWILQTTLKKETQNGTRNHG